jgi:hypothetical protein
MPELHTLIFNQSITLHQNVFLDLSQKREENLKPFDFKEGFK